MFHSHCFILVVKIVIVLLLHNVSFPLLYSSDHDYFYCFIAPQCFVHIALFLWSRLLFYCSTMFRSHCFILVIKIIVIVLLLHNVSFTLLYSSDQDYRYCFIAPQCFVHIALF